MFADVQMTSATGAVTEDSAAARLPRAEGVTDPPRHPCRGGPAYYLSSQDYLPPLPSLPARLWTDYTGPFLFALFFTQSFFRVI